MNFVALFPIFSSFPILVRQLFKYSSVCQLIKNKFLLHSQDDKLPLSKLGYGSWSIEKTDSLHSMFNNIYLVCFMFILLVALGIGETFIPILRIASLA